MNAVSATTLWRPASDRVAHEMHYVRDDIALGSHAEWTGSFDCDDLSDGHHVDWVTGMRGVCRKVWRDSSDRIPGHSGSGGRSNGAVLRIRVRMARTGRRTAASRDDAITRSIPAEPRRRASLYSGEGCLSDSGSARNRWWASGRARVRYAGHRCTRSFSAAGGQPNRVSCARPRSTQGTCPTAASAYRSRSEARD